MTNVYIFNWGGEDENNEEHMIESIKAGGNIYQSLKRGKEHQIDRFTKMLTIFKKSLKKEMVSEYEATLKRLEEV